MTSFVVSIDQIDHVNHYTSRDRRRSVVTSFKGKDGFGLNQREMLDTVSDRGVFESIVLLDCCQ